MWRKENSCVPLMDMKTHKASVENNVEFPQKTINETAT